MVSKITFNLFGEVIPATCLYVFEHETLRTFILVDDPSVSNFESVISDMI